jgi:hypothetical protein
MSQSVRSLLTVLAALAAALSAANPVGMPGWLAIAVAGLSAGLAGVGILPPQWRVTVKSPTSATAFKGSSPAGVNERQLPHDPNVRPRVDDRKKPHPSPMSRNGLLMALGGLLAALAFSAAAAPAARADFVFGCGAWWSKAPGCTDYVYYQNGSTTYLNVGNATYDLATGYGSEGYAAAHCPEVNGGCYVSGHVSYVRHSNTSVTVWAMWVNYVWNWYCRYKSTVTGTNSKTWPWNGIEAQFCGYYSP